MDNIIYILFVSIFVPILLMTLLVEKKARLPVAFMLIGIFVSVFAAEINGWLLRVLPMDKHSMTVIVNPVTEELLKALKEKMFDKTFSFSHFDKILSLLGILGITALISTRYSIIVP